MEWQPTPVLLPGEFHGWRSLVGYSPWDCKNHVVHDRTTSLSRISLQGSNRETDIEDRLMDMRRGEGRLICMESNMETYITMCEIDGQQEFAVWLRKLKQGLCINLEGWDGEGDGRKGQ